MEAAEAKVMEQQQGKVRSFTRCRTRLLSDLCRSSPCRQVFQCSSRAHVRQCQLQQVARVPVKADLARLVVVEEADPRVGAV